MRQYTIFEANARGGISFLGWAQRLAVHWRKRRKLRQLLDLDDYILSDIGLDRAEVISVMRLAWYIDPIAELERVKRYRAGRGIRTR